MFNVGTGLGDRLPGFGDVLVAGGQGGFVLVDATSLDVDLVALAFELTFGFFKQQSQMTPLPLSGFVLLTDLTEIHSEPGQCLLSLLPLIGEMLRCILRLGDGGFKCITFRIERADLDRERLRFLGVSVLSGLQLVVFGGGGPFLADDSFQIGIETPLVVFKFSHPVELIGESSAGVLLLFACLGGLRKKFGQGVVHVVDSAIETLDLGSEILDLQPS